MARTLWAAIWLGTLGLSAELPAADDALAVTDRVDALIEQRWTEAGVEPASPAKEAEFLRRVYLDLTGVIPSVGEVRQYLADGNADRRGRLIEALLAKPNHASHLATVWRETMLPRNAMARQFNQNGLFDNWLQGHFADNTPYDKLVAELLTATGQINQSGPVLYYTALEGKPEELAASTARIFLGVQLDCAQCHDHPFDRWKQKDFWGHAAFFARLQRPAGQQPFLVQVADGAAGEVKIPQTETVIAPRFLNAGEDSADVAGRTRRQQLSAWLTSAENPYFARATVNRVWGLLFGYGLVHPVDGFSENNPASHEEVLEVLARDFASHGFDLRRLFRVLANTRAYQLSSEVPPGELVEPRLFSRMAIKSLTPEQLYNCLMEATRKREGAAGMQPGVFSAGLNPGKQSFLAKFEAPTQGATEYQAGIPQALTMMNGQLMAELTDPARCDLLGALIDAPFLSNEQRLDVLFLSTVSRPPDEKSRAALLAFLEKGATRTEQGARLSDVLWGLLNSAEFMFNH